MKTHRLRVILWVAAAVVVLGLTVTAIGSAGARTADVHRADLTTTATTTAGTPATALPPIHHVFVLVLENESAANTFPTSGPAPSPYLADTMRSEGAFLPNYYGTGHNSNDNYTAMISGQAPNLDNSEDCALYSDFPADVNSGAPYDQQEGEGCVYPADIPTIASQLQGAGLTWRDYNEDMGNDPGREAATCGHPALNSMDKTQSEENGDAYATRHNPFVYFHGVIDNTALCNSHVVNLTQLGTDLQSAASTPNYVFITPNLCHDGHDATCSTPGENGGFTGINDFLSEWVPKITSSPAYRDNGLLITTFDEAATSDASSCCGEVAGPGEATPGLSGAGGGRIGAVLMSPCIAPGTVSDVAYNHYSMLGSVENLFGLPHLGYANLPGESYFGSDIFTGSCGARTTGAAPPGPSGSTPAPAASSSATAAARGDAGHPSVMLRGRAAARSAVGATVSVPLSFRSSSPGVTYTLSVRRLMGQRATAWRTLLTGTHRQGDTFAGHSAQTYQFRLQATNAAGLTSPAVTITVVIPTYAKAAGASLSGPWRYRSLAGAWRGHAEEGTRGASYRYGYTGGSLQLLAARWPAGGRIRVRFDGVAHTLSVHAGRRSADAVVFSMPASIGRHRVTISVLSGTLALEGLVPAELG